MTLPFEEYIFDFAAFVFDFVHDHLRLVPGYNLVFPPLQNLARAAWRQFIRVISRSGERAAHQYRRSDFVGMVDRTAVFIHLRDLFQSPSNKFEQVLAEGSHRLSMDEC